MLHGVMLRTSMLQTTALSSFELDVTAVGKSLSTWSMASALVVEGLAKLVALVVGDTGCNSASL